MVEMVIVKSYGKLMVKFNLREHLMNDDDDTHPKDSHTRVEKFHENGHCSESMSAKHTFP